MKIYAITFLICFIITMIVMAVAVMEDVMECKEMQANGNERAGEPMKKRDRMLLIPRMLLIAIFISIPAPLTLALYAVLMICMVFAPEN